MTKESSGVGLGRWFRRLAVVYLVLLAASTAWRLGTKREPASDDELRGSGLAVAHLQTVRGESTQPGVVRLVYTDRGPREAPAVLLVHGSPGGRSAMRGLGDRLEERFRVLNVDLPGFGESERDLPDYSFLAHAHYLRELFDQLAIDRAHLVGFSMGGGVVLHLDNLLGDRSNSVSLISAIGVQEHELFGNYAMNHAIHGLQLGALWTLCEMFPHFGVLDHGFFSVEYARNFYDSDQRPLRGLLEQVDKPFFILQGEVDPLVPIAAAREHARIVPQAEFVIDPGDHFLVFQHPEVVAEPLRAFLEQDEAGTAPVRTEAEPERIQAAAAPPPEASEGLVGFALFMVLAGIALSTLISEDLACIGAGAIAAQGRIPFWPAVLACLAGIVVGDLLIYFIGRWLGPKALRVWPFSRLVSEAALERTARWFEQRGLLAIFATRFMPGTRLPTYFSAGALRTNPLKFTVYFVIAAVVWTPALVWISVRIGGELTEKVEMFERALPLAFAVTVVIGLLLIKVVVPSLTWRGRRQLLGSLRRKLHWEFWPPWIVYPPVFLYVLWLGLKHRSLTLFCASNPGIETGGFVGESKNSILANLEGAGEALPRHAFLPVSLPAAERIQRFEDLANQTGTYPIVLKPDAGQRGSGVHLARDLEDARGILEDASVGLVAQEYAPGVEFGALAERAPDESSFRITSLVRKRLATVEGDGVHTLEHLILADPRAVCMAKVYFEANDSRLDSIPVAGEQVVLSPLGTHARGAIFEDASELVTPELEASLDRIARSFDGFHLGRFDLRVPDESALSEGRGLRVLELNGVTSEPAHIYDRRHSFWFGQRALRRHWRRAFEMGAANRERGAEVPSLLNLISALRNYRRAQRSHVRHAGSETVAPRQLELPTDTPAAL